MKENAMQPDPIQFILGFFWALPFWTKVLLVLLVVLKLGWPELFAERVIRVRHRRWRRRYRWYE
jgi:hypothetical protein